MTDGRRWPNIVHRPYHRFSALQNLADIVQRQHSLINPMQVNNVGLLEFRQFRNVSATIGNIYFEQVFAFKMKSCPHNKALPKEIPLQAPRLWQCRNRQLVRFLVTHQHLCLHTVVVQCIHQAVGGNGCPTRPFARIYYQYSHTLL